MLKEISIEIIRKCPNNCVHCSSVSNENCKERLDYGRFMSVVREAAELGASTICLSGGEPFLHDRIVDMVKFASSLGLNIYIYTSGIVFDGQNRKTFLDKDILEAISQDVTKLIFNLEAATPKTYDAVMGTSGCFEIMKQSIRNAHEACITTEAHFVPMKLNMNEAEEVVELCQSLHVSKISFLRLVVHGRAQANEAAIALSKEELEHFKVFLEKLQKRAGIDIRIGVPLSLEAECHRCEAAKGKLNIKYDGKVFPCEVFKNERMSHCLKGMQPDSIYDKGLTEIYRHSPYLELVRKLEEEFSCTGECETCIGQYLIMKERESSKYGRK